jgi:UDP-glucose 4-epimerase
VKPVLVTGVAGSVGAHVARRFLAEGYAVIGVDNLSAGGEENVPAGVDLIVADLTDARAVSRIPRGCGQVLHLAGQSSGEVSFDDPVADLSKNVITTLNLVRYGIDNAVERLLFASSMSVYGAVPDAPIAEDREPRPLSCYGVGKLAAEAYLRVFERQLPFVALRMFNTYGPGQNMLNLRQGMVSIYVAQALETGRIEVKGSLARFRDFVYIDDVVEAWWRASRTSDALGRALNVATGVRTSVAQLLQQVIACVPGSEYFLGAGTPGDQDGIFADTTLLRQTLGVTRFTPLDEGLHRFVEWARAHRHSTPTQSVQ